MDDISYCIKGSDLKNHVPHFRKGKLRLMDNTTEIKTEETNCSVLIICDQIYKRN